MANPSSHGQQINFDLLTNRSTHFICHRLHNEIFSSSNSIHKEFTISNLGTKRKSKITMRMVSTTEIIYNSSKILTNNVEDNLVKTSIFEEKYSRFPMTFN